MTSNPLVVLVSIENELHGSKHMYNLGLCYIASSLRKYSNVNVNLLVWDNLKKSAHNMAKEIAKYKPIAVGISTVTMSHYFGEQLVKEIKNCDKEIKTIIGGPHATLCPEEVLKNENIDSIVIGEGDKTFPELVNYYCNENNFSIEEIKGIGYRNNTRIYLNEPRKFIKDIDELPLPARDLIPLVEYKVPGIISTSRGCAGKCIFCSSPTIWNYSVRLRSAKNVLNEINELYHKYNIKKICFIDDWLTCDRKRLREIMNGIDKYPDLEWYCESRVDTMNPSILNEMTQKGCKEIQYGIEVSSQPQLNQIKKGITIDQIELIIKSTIKSGIKPVLSFVFGFPNQSKEDLIKTINYFCVLKKMGVKTILVAPLNPIPGTYIYNNSGELGIDFEDQYWLKKEYSNALNSPIKNNGDLSQKELNTLLISALTVLFSDTSKVITKKKEV